MTPNNNCGKATTCSVTSQIAQHPLCSDLSKSCAGSRVSGPFLCTGGIASGMRPIGSADWWYTDSSGLENASGTSSEV
jgi:hypothetical protein